MPTATKGLVNDAGRNVSRIAAADRHARSTGRWHVQRGGKHLGRAITPRSVSIGAPPEVLVGTCQTNADVVQTGPSIVRWASARLWAALDVGIRRMDVASMHSDLALRHRSDLADEIVVQTKVRDVTWPRRRREHSQDQD